MIEGLMKKIPVAMLNSFDKMKGSMLLSMAKGMAPRDAEAMARHWGYIPENPCPKVASKITKEAMEDIAQTIIPDRPLTEDMKAVLRSISEERSVEPATVDRIENRVKDIVDTVMVKLAVLPAIDSIIQKEVEFKANETNLPLEKLSSVLPPSAVVSDSSEAKGNDDELIHPIFGRKIVDLGYKTVYLTSISLLARTQVWERQRTLRPDRAARIASSKIALGRTKSLSGVITMFSDKLSGQSGIVDGQHRAGALMMLSQQGYWDGLEKNILIDVFETENDEEIVALFKEINSAEPVRLVDMPGEVGPILQFN